MTNKEIAVIAKFVSKKDRIGEVEDVLSSLIAPTRAEKGCVYYGLYQDPEDSTNFMMVERWASYDEWQAHLDADHVNNAKNAVDKCLAEPIEVQWVECVS